MAAMKIGVARVLLAAVLLGFGAPGCSSAQKRTYEVTVKNESTRPVTVWLTKNGPPYEQGWKAPEDLAIELPVGDERIAGVVVPAGRTASTGQVVGHFAPGVQAILRVYLGQKGFDEILAISRGSPDRMEIVLKPGANDILLKSDEFGRVSVRTDSQ
jgi:hypothetical protein